MNTARTLTSKNGRRTGQNRTRSNAGLSARMGMWEEAMAPKTGCRIFHLIGCREKRNTLAWNLRTERMCMLKLILIQSEIHTRSFCRIFYPRSEERPVG